MVIAAIRCDEDFERAVKSDVKIIFDLAPDIFNAEKRIKAAHDAQKVLFIHIDLASGVGKDKSGIEFLKGLGLDGIISTKAAMVKIAKEAGLKAVQRFFLIDSKSVTAAIEGIKTAKADMVEVMPGIAVRVIKKLKADTDIPIIAGGLIETQKDINSALENGAFAVSVGNCDLWQ